MKEDRIPTDGATWTLIWGRVFCGLSCYMFVAGALVSLVMLAVHAWAVEYESEQAQFIDVPSWMIVLLVCLVLTVVYVPALMGGSNARQWRYQRRVLILGMLNVILAPLAFVLLRRWKHPDFMARFGIERQHKGPDPESGKP